jgi:hypothetical protein
MKVKSFTHVLQATVDLFLFWEPNYPEQQRGNADQTAPLPRSDGLFTLKFVYVNVPRF